MAWQPIVEFLGGATLFACVLGYIGKATVDAFLKGRLAEHKAALDLASSEHSSKLELLAVEHSVRFQRLHSERADVIKDTYSKLAVLDEALDSALRMFQQVGENSLTEKVDRIAGLYNDLRAYYTPQRIFLPEDICEEIDAIINLAHGIFLSVTVYPVETSAIEYKYNREVLGERHEFWEKARKAHSKEFKAAKQKLEYLFRSALGFETKTRPSVPTGEGSAD